MRRLDARLGGPAVTSTPEHWTDLRCVVENVVLMENTLVVLVVDGVGTYAGEHVEGLICQIVINLGRSPQAVQVVDQAHAQLRSWQLRGEQVRYVVAPGRYPRLSDETGRAVSLPNPK